MEKILKHSNDSSFKGFASDVRNFLLQLKANNNREWFEANRSYYEQSIKEPSKSLVYSLSKRFIEKNLPLTADPRRSIFRIYRDIRFSKNKEPYKTNIGIYFYFGLNNPDKKPINAPGMYFHIDESECFIAVGLHQPMPEQLLAIRKSVYNNWDEFEKIINTPELTNLYSYRLIGDKLKKTPPGFPSEHPSSEYLKLKNFDIYNDLDIENTYSEKLIDIIEQYALSSLPFLEFISEAISDNP